MKYIVFCCCFGFFLQHCKQVFGVEIIEDAIEDAKFNAEENGIENSKFYAGNCDDYIHSLVYEADNENLLAVLDPPRAGIREFLFKNTHFSYLKYFNEL